MTEPETTPAETITPPPSDLQELRQQVKVMIGQQIHKTLQTKAPSAAQLHAAMKWIDQTTPTAGEGTKSPIEAAVEAARRSMSAANSTPDLSPGPDETE